MQRAVEITSRGLTLRGMLHMPENAKGKVPLALIFHGFTGNKMESHFIMVKLSRLLEKNGIASLRFDFGGSGESDGDFIDMTLSGEIEDARNILDYALKLDGVDVGRIGAVGLSMGGVVASALAGLRKENLRALCLWAPAGNMKDIVWTPETIENIELIRKAGFTDLGGLLLGTGFLDDVLKLDLYEKARPYNKNVLIMHGDKDLTVPLAASEKYLECYEGRAKLKKIKDADHTFNNAEWEKEVIDSTVAFLKDEMQK